MALDEPKEHDLTFSDRGVTFTIDKDLFERLKSIQIDFKDSGFQITSGVPVGGDSCNC